MKDFTELNFDEITSIDGGKKAWWEIFTYVNDHWDSWVDSWKKGWNDYPY